MRLPSDALLQHLPSYLAFSYLGRGVSLHGCSSKVQPLLLTLDEGYLLTAAPPDLDRGIAPLGPPAPVQPLLLGCGVAPPSRCPWHQGWGSSSRLLLRCHSLTLLATAPDLGHRVAPLGCHPWPQTWGSFSITWTLNFQMFKLVLEMAEEPEIKLPTSTGSSKKQASSRKEKKKNLFLLYWLCQSLWLCGLQ